MTYHLFSTGAASALFGESPVISADAAEDLRDVAELLGAAARIHASARDAHAAAVAEGLREGRAAALAERDAFAAERLAAPLADIAAAQQRLEENIAALALRALRHILGYLPEDMVVAGVVTRATDRLPTDAIEHVAVAPALVDAVAARLPTVLAQTVVGDAGLPLFGCVVAGRGGRIIASLDLQLERLAECWQVEGAA